MSDGIALKLNIRAIADGSVFEIDASGTLQLNTGNSMRLGVAANSFLLDLPGKISLLKVLQLDAGLRVEVKNGDAWSLRADASLDFFGIATLSGSVYLDSEGGFDVQLRGRMVIGSSSFGMVGSSTSACARR